MFITGSAFGEPFLRHSFLIGEKESRENPQAHLSLWALDFVVSTSDLGGLFPTQDPPWERGAEEKIHHVKITHPRFLLLLFRVPIVIIRSLIHLELILVHGIQKEEASQVVYW